MKELENKIQNLKHKIRIEELKVFFLEWVMAISLLINFFFLVYYQWRWN